MRIFITGGCKTGKSSLAQKLAVEMCPKGSPLYYVATMIPADNEDNARISRHRMERAGLEFETIEAPYELSSILDKCDTKGFYVFDSVTALLANEMFKEDGSVIEDAYIKVAGKLDKLLAGINNTAVVSDYIHSDACIYDNITEAYRYGLAYIHRSLAKTCGAVVEACYGNFIIHKGPDDLKDIVYAVF